MSRDRRDQRGGHGKSPHYGKESSAAKEITRDKRRAEAQRSVDKYIPCPYCNDDGVACDLEGEIVSDPCWCVDNERHETKPEKGTGGWMSW